MSSTYLYSDNDTTYDMSVSSTGTVLSYTDITTRVPLPSIQANANKYLKVRNDGQNLEWAEVEIGGGLELILDERTTSDPPSVCFEDNSGTKYNTGINMYRDVANANKQTISLYTNNAERLKINEDAISASTYRAGNGSGGTPSYSFTADSDTGMYFESSGGAERLRFSINGTDRILASSSGVTQITGRINTDAGTVSAPSIYLTDTATGLYRPAANELAVSCNNGLCANFTSSGITIGATSTNARRNVTVNGSVILGLGATTLSNSTYAWDTSFGTTACTCWDINTASGNVIIQLNSSGTTATNQLFGRFVRFARYNGNTSGTVTFQATGGTVRLNMSSGSEAVTTGNNFTIFSIPANTGCIFEIMRIDANQYFLNVLAYWNQTTGVSTSLNHTTTAGLGAVGTPSYSFRGDENTGIYSPAADQVAITTNGVQNTNFTTTGVDIGLNNVNNTNLKTLTQNGASNFNTFTPSYSSFLMPQTAIGTINQALSGCDFDGTNYVVSVAGTGTGARLFVSSNLSTWTTISDTQISLGNSQVQYGNGIWVYLSRVASQTRQIWTSTAPATTWTQIGSVVPWTSNGTAQRLKFINGQFIVLFSSSVLRYSSDGLNWTSYTVNATAYNLTDIAYSPELQRYIIVTGGAATLYFSGNTITNTSAFTAVTTNVEAANCCSYSPKYGLFLYHGNSNNQRYYISRDGINWTYYTNPTTVTNSNNTIWINDFGGFFLDMQFNQNQVAVSRDGLSFQVIANNLTMTTVNAVYNSTGKVLLIVGSSNVWGTFRNMLTDFNNYVDSDAIYNTFNSNIRFADVIEYQNQVITTATGNNHFTISQFTRPEVVFDTSSVNANIYLQGASFNGRVGCKFKFIKSNNNNNVRIHGYETTTLISPTGNVNSFNAQSIPQTYSIIPAGYFGSFYLSRVSDAGNGVWVIDNVDVYDGNGASLLLGDIQIGAELINTLGSETTPSYTFTGDTNTGFYSSGADTLDFSAGGTRVASVDTSGFSVVSGALKPTRRIQYTPSGVQTASFTISTLLQHLIRTDPGAVNDLVVTLDNVGVGTHYVITKETSTRELQVTASGSITYNGSNRSAYPVIVPGKIGIWKIWQVSATAWIGEVSTF